MFGYKKTENIENSMLDSRGDRPKPYAIVSACYNVSKYIDDFILSVINQSLDFTTNIYLVLVDDGSTDNTSEKIRNWQRKYPQNIKTLFKENGGQSSARNLGIEFVNSEWVTFTDPDDFLDRDYFKTIDNFLKDNKSEDLSLLCTNIIFYKELNKLFVDNHPLSFKFSIDERILNINSLSSNIQLHASSALFKTSIIKENKILFPEIKPNFEDAYFVCLYFINTKNDKLALLKNAKYYYRKREDINSSLDLSWNDTRKYSELFVNGYIPILLQARKYKEIRELLESIVLYSLLWQITYVLNDNHDLAFLSEAQKEAYLSYLDKCFTYISERTIYKFSACGMNHYLRSGIINCFKKDSNGIQDLISIEKYDLVKNEVLLKYCYVGNIKEDFYINNTKVYPSSYKLVKNTFLSRTFIFQKLVWVPIKTECFNLNVSINNKPAKLSCVGLIKDSFKKQEIIDLLSFNGMLLKNSENKPWIFVDRIDRADDNAEHLYRYVKNQNLKNDIYFALDKNSSDWQRLSNDGFKLVDFGSVEHLRIFNQCSKIISSQIDNFVTDYWNNGSWRNKQIIFLRHGVSKDDASIWLNSKKRIDLLISTTSDEYHSIIDNYSRYLFTEKEVKLLGLCRFDSLQKVNDDIKDVESRKQILVFPTWRNNLFKNIQSNNNELSLNKGDYFKKVTSNVYFKSWHNFLASEELKELCESLGYQIVFYAHAKVAEFLEFFEIPNYIHIEQSKNLGLQSLFAKSVLLVTDYSSVAFDMGYLNKPILYFQFDKELFWEQQSFRKGYFSYENNGFGQVCLNCKHLLDSLKAILECNCLNPKLYKERIDNTYCYRDKNNCQRNYQAIIDLDVSRSEYKYRIEGLYSTVQYFLDSRNWSDAINLIDSVDDLLIEEKRNLIDLRKVIVARMEIDNGNLDVSNELISNITKVAQKFVNFEKTTRLIVLILLKKWNEALDVLNDKTVIKNGNYAKLWLEIQIWKNNKNTQEFNLLKQKLIKYIELLPNEKEKNIYLDFIEHKYLGICKKFMVRETDNPEVLFLNMVNANAYYKLVSENLFLGLLALQASINEGIERIQLNIKEILIKKFGILVDQLIQMPMLV